jgi:hypothetical protein
MTAKLCSALNVGKIEHRAQTFGELWASSFAQKCMKNKCGESSIMWLCKAVISGHLD